MSELSHPVQTPPHASEKDQAQETGEPGKSGNSPNLFKWLLQLCLDTSISGKLVGMLVVSTMDLLALFLINNNALNTISEQNRHIKEQTVPRYQANLTILSHLNTIPLDLINLLHYDKNNLHQVHQQLADTLAQMDKSIALLLEENKLTATTSADSDSHAMLIDLTETLDSRQAGLQSGYL